jgi:integrase
MGFTLPSNPVHQTKLLRPNNPRERRVTASELERLLAACESTSSRCLPALIQLAVETRMRRSELLAMRWHDVNLEAGTVHLRNTKNGHRQPSISCEPPRVWERWYLWSRLMQSGLHGSA